MSREAGPTEYRFAAARDVIDALPGMGCPIPMDRRAFLKLAAALPCLAGCTTMFADWLVGPVKASSLSSDGWDAPVEARFYEKLPGKNGECKLCPRECVVDDGERGYCGVRENRGGTYYSLVHSAGCRRPHRPHREEAVLPFPARQLALSVATAGCNVNCKLCQNWEISQVRPEQVTAAHTCRRRTWPRWPRESVCPQWLTPTANPPSSTNT